MGLAEQIVAAIRARNASGETYKQMHLASGITQSYIHGVANHRYDPLKMSLQTFLALFPSAQISLTGAAASAPACCSDDLERVRMEAERDRLAHERRELELERRIFELEKQLAERPRVPRDEKPAPYHVEPPSILSPSNK